MKRIKEQIRSDQQRLFETEIKLAIAMLHAGKITEARLVFEQVRERASKDGLVEREVLLSKLAKLKESIVQAEKRSQPAQ